MSKKKDKDIKEKLLWDIFKNDLDKEGKSECSKPHAKEISGMNITEIECILTKWHKENKIDFTILEPKNPNAKIIVKIIK